MPDLTTEVPNPQIDVTAEARSASGKFQHELQSVTVYGITNRHLSNDGAHFEDGGLEEKRDDEIHYYRETVPVAGKKGDYAATGSGKIEVITKAQFDKETAESVKEHGGKLGIYIHGIRNAIGEPGQKAAEMSADSGQTFVLEDWASTAEVKASSKWNNLTNIGRQQVIDYESSRRSQGMINSTAEELMERFGAGNVDIVAHSRGSVNEVRLLADMQAKGKAPVHSATFAHSDIDVGDFAHSLPDFYKSTKHVNVLYNQRDSALGWSGFQKTGKADLNDGCTVNDSARVGKVGLTDQYFQNQARGIGGADYFLSIKDVTNDRDENGHMMTSKLVADIITNPAIYQSKDNELKDGPQFKALEPALCKVTQTATKDDATPSAKKPESNSINDRKIDPNEVARDFVSMSPEVTASRAKRLAAARGPQWIIADNIWASLDTPAKP